MKMNKPKHKPRNKVRLLIIMIVILMGFTGCTLFNKEEPIRDEIYKAEISK